MKQQIKRWMFVFFLCLSSHCYSIEDFELETTELWPQRELDKSVEEVDTEYRLKVGDTFYLEIYGENDTGSQVYVDPAGNVSYMYVRSYPVTGKTIPQFQEEIEQELQKYYRSARLSVTPLQFNTEFYTIGGEVYQPGKQPVIGRPSVLSAIAAAGGLVTIYFRDRLTDLADLEKSFLIRNGEYIPVDFTRLVREGDLSQDLPLYAGDYLYFPSVKTKKVYILGEVGSSVYLEYMNSMTLVEAIAEAGGVNDFASSRVIVLRGSLSCPVRYLVDYDRIVKGCAPDFRLCPGDIVYVPEKRFTYLNEVIRSVIGVFVTNLADEAGFQAYIKSHPHASGDFDNRVVTIGSGSSGTVEAP